MPRRRREEAGQLPHLVQKIYFTLVDAIVEAPQSYTELLRHFMPLILSELDVMCAFHPEVAEVLQTVFDRLWRRVFPTIPPPRLPENAGAPAMLKAVVETLQRYRAELMRLRHVWPATKREEERVIEDEALLFMDAVARQVFRLLGVVK